MIRTPRDNLSSQSVKRRTPEAGDPYGVVVATFAHDQHVAYGGGKGFGSGALKVDNKIFAMISSKGQFIVKLPAHRVNEFVRNGTGQHFDPGRGKKMKEWLAVNGKPEMWTALATEARQFVGRVGSNSKPSTGRITASRRVKQPD